MSKYHTKSCTSRKQDKIPPASPPEFLLGIFLLVPCPFFNSAFHLHNYSCCCPFMVFFALQSLSHVTLLPLCLPCNSRFHDSGKNSILTKCEYPAGPSKPHIAYLSSQRVTVEGLALRPCGHLLPVIIENQLNLTPPYFPCTSTSIFVHPAGNRLCVFF